MMLGWTSRIGLVVPVSCQCGGEHATTPGDAALHGADGDVERVGDLLVVQVGDVAQHDRDAEVLGHLQQRRLQHVAVEDLVDGRAEPRSAGSRSARSSSCTTDSGRRRRRRSSSRLALVAMRYTHVLNADRPSKRCEAAHDRDERLLGGVGGVAVAGDAPAHGVDAVVVGADQPVERIAVTRLRRRNERSIVDGRLHASPERQLADAAAEGVLGAVVVRAELDERHQHVTRGLGDGHASVAVSVPFEVSMGVPHAA